jgi:ABC-type Fe3+-hydroxamate transport system substrate-binding protein
MKHYPVWISDVKDLEDALAMIMLVGKLVSKEEKSLNLNNKIREQFTNFLSANPLNNKKLKVAYLIWKNPMIAAAENTFIDNMISTCGFINAFKGLSRYPEITDEMLKASAPDFLFLSSEPFPFKEKHMEEFRLLCPDTKIYLVDGELFSWYGSRLLKAPDYFRSLVNQIQNGN